MTPSSQATSINEIEQLRAENQRLRAQLDAVLFEARQNQIKLQRFDQVERRIISADSLAQLVDTLLLDYKTRFELDRVTLALVDPTFEVAKLLAHPPLPASSRDDLILLDNPRPLEALFSAPYQPLLCPYTAAHDVLFETETDAPPPRSVALLPLVFHGQLIGSLNLGSSAPQRFDAASSTDFLQRLAGLVAVCFHSALDTERLKLVGLTDVLTGVHNRRYFESRALEEVSAARRSGAPLVCMFLDVDKFKRLNDTLGHQAGDVVLNYVARLIKVQLRGSDVVARYGGEEFVVLLPATSADSGLETAERIRRVVAAQTVPVPASEAVRITLSIGVSMLESSDAQLSVEALSHTMIARADKALYQAKESGRNRVVFAHEPLGEA